jgi:hypothetical protein
VKIVGDLKGDDRANATLLLDGLPAPADFDPNGRTFLSADVQFRPEASGPPELESLSVFMSQEALMADLKAKAAAARAAAAEISRRLQEKAAPGAPIQAPPARRFQLSAAAAPAAGKLDISDFVQSFSNALLNKNQICIRVQGAEPDKAAYVLARVTADARAAGLSVGRSECETSRFESSRYDVEIRFATDAERAVHDIVNRRDVAPRLDKPAGADRPIRAWYSVVDDKAGNADWSPWLHVGVLTGMEPRARDNASGPHRLLDFAIVVVDPARTQGLSLDALSDYVAMLALSQPRILDRCNVLPSVTDLYAGACPGRAAPSGLTEADAAYLKALYRGSSELRATRQPSELVDGMARRLGDFNVAAR